MGYIILWLLLCLFAVLFCFVTILVYFVDFACLRFGCTLGVGAFSVSWFDVLVCVTFDGWRCMVLLCVRLGGVAFLWT